MKKALVLALLGSAAMLACAQNPPPGAAATAPAAPATPAAAAPSTPKAEPGTPDARALEAIAKLNPQIQVDHLGAAPLPGFREVIVAGQTLYVSDDGKYLMQGNLFDMEARKDLSQVTLGNMRRTLLAQVPQGERIVFAPANPQHRVTVFTDVSCGYCRRLHNEIAEYNRLGIAIEYLAFPRSGPAGEDFRTLEAVWCASDRNAAMTEAKNGKKPQANRCANPVQRHYALGQRIGLTGTPMIVAANGVNTPGYLPPAQLKQWLDAQAAAK